MKNPMKPANRWATVDSANSAKIVEQLIYGRYGAHAYIAMAKARIHNGRPDLARKHLVRARALQLAAAQLGCVRLLVDLEELTREMWPR